jgi:hypothetical protein
MHHGRNCLLNILRSASFLCLCTIQITLAQMHESAFGEIRTFSTVDKFEKSVLVSTDSCGITTFASWSAHDSNILLAVFDSTLSTVKYSLKHVNMEFDDLYAADFNEDGSTDFLLVNKQHQSMALILSLVEDSLQVTGTTKIPFEPQRIMIGDYNNDTHLDVLVYAQNSTGILPLKGNGKGKLLLGKVIAPDNAIGACEYAFVNNDNLIDLVLWDWVKSELHILCGVGKGRFIDQSIFPVRGEVDKIVAVSMARGHSLDLILKMMNPSEFQLWEGNDFGDFQLKNHIPIHGNIKDFSIADVNDDGLNDIIATVYPASLQVIFNNDGDAFSERIEYASGSDPQNIVVLQTSVEGLKDCIVFDSGDSQFFVFKNAMRRSEFADSVQIATGIIPTEMITNDFNRDGISDIALINTKNPSLSMYIGRKNSIPSGPFTFTLTDKPAHIAFYSATDTTLQFILSYPQSNQISFLTIDTAGNSITNAFIGSEGDARVVETNSHNNDQAEFATFNSTTLEGCSLSFYEQLGQTTFIERTFRLSPPDELLGASIGDVNNDSLLDVIYAYRVGDTSTVELSVSFGDSSYSMKKRIVSRELELPGVKQLSFWISDFDKDGILDLLIQAGPPYGYLIVARGKGEGYFEDPKIIASGMPVIEQSDIQLIDVDSDGLTDIVTGSQHNSRISWFRNEGECVFGLEKTLYIEDGMSYYAIADMDADGIKDLAITFSKKGILKIIHGKKLFLR